jgi:tetratricopeptide (TPR) repeat protein
MVVPYGGTEAGADVALASRSSSPQGILQIAREYDRKGHIDDAVSAYEAAIRAADGVDAATMAEALRRLAVVRHRRGESADARALCERSHAVACAAGQPDLVAEALNTSGGLELVDERFEAARHFFVRAASVASSPDLLGRLEQNLGTVASIQGDLEGALDRYRRSLEGFLAAGNEQGCAVAYHNLGVISIELRQWPEADRHLGACLQMVQRTGDLHLRGLALLNHAETLMGLGRAREARLEAETAASIFDEMHAPRELADAYRVVGCLLRAEGELGRAHARLQLAVEVAATSRCELSEAEATRDLALVVAALGRPDEAVALMRQASAALERHRPSAGAARTLAGDYPASVRAWGELLGATHPAWRDHAERAAGIAADVARALGHDDEGQARVRVAAYLRELDPECLGEGSLSWEVRSVLRYHRERRDGSGPLGLRDDAIPLDAEIVGIAAARADAPVTGDMDAWWRPAVVAACRRVRPAPVG